MSKIIPLHFPFYFDAAHPASLLDLVKVFCINIAGDSLIELINRYIIATYNIGDIQ